MKKLLLPLCAMSVILSACGDDQEGFQLASQEGITFTVADFIDENGTRVDVSVNASGANFTWTEGDTLGVFPQNGYQTAFPIGDGAGTNTAVFDGADWALRSNASYAAYYPLQHPMDAVNKKAISVSYEGQVQNGNGSTSHLGDYDYLAAQYSPVDANGNANFTLNHLGCLVRFQLTMPEANTYKSMTLSCEDACLKTEARYDLTATTPALSAKKLSESITLGLSNVSTTEANQVLTLYMMLPPMDLSGREISISVSGEREYSAAITGKNLKAGNFYGFSNKMFPPHEWVDLGLSVLWATCNVGANSPEEYGNYYAWGETAPKTTYDWTTYSHCEGSETTLNKYCNNSNFGAVDNKTELTLEDDAATTNWGSDWRMPTGSEQDELLQKCTWNWVTVNNISGYVVVGPNDNSIFLPAAGSKTGNNTSMGIGEYWSSSLNISVPEYSSMAQIISFRNGRVSGEDNARCVGYSVRPVRQNPNYIRVASIQISGEKTQLKPSETLQLSVIITPSDATDASVIWRSSRPSIATVSADGLVTAIEAGTTVISATTIDGTGKYAEYEVTVKEGLELSAPANLEAVDLGVVVDGKKVLWANMNVGAESPEEYGGYFAWGETVPYGGEDKSNVSNYNYANSYTKTYYDWSTYKYSNNGTSEYNCNLTKYCSNSRYGDNGFTDTKTVLDPEDDAATANWGADWRMPTHAELQALHDQCTWTMVTSYNGKSVNGYKITGNGHEIFLPAAGVRYFGSPEDVGTYGNYWSSSLRESYYDRAWNLYFVSSFIDQNGYNGRDSGRSVRPVRATQENSVHISSLSLNKTTLTLDPDATGTLIVSVTPSNAESRVTWTSSNPSVATVDALGVVTAVKSGTTVIRATTIEGTGMYAECNVTVKGQVSSGNAPAAAEAVDLGLIVDGKKVLWANMNVGAESPTDYGYYFAWGETVPCDTKNSYYDWNSYKYCKGSSSTMTKYVLQSRASSDGYNGYYDNKTILDSEDDAASTNWGGDWRMPTLSELKALRDKCTWTWITMNGVKGYKIVGSNDNFIFLPAAGSYEDGSSHRIGAAGTYWTSSLGTVGSSHAFDIDFDGGGRYIDDNDKRSFCQPIRPVLSTPVAQ